MLVLQRKLPSPGFLVEIVMIDYDGTVPSKTKVDSVVKGSGPSSSDKNKVDHTKAELAAKQDNDDNVFWDSDGEETVPSRSVDNKTSAKAIAAPESSSRGSRTTGLVQETEQLSLRSESAAHVPASTSKETSFHGAERTCTIPNFASGDIKAIAADASVFSFGDEEDYESE